MLVAPLGGTFEAADAKLGDTLAAGAVIGRVVTRREAQEIVAQHGGVLVEWLVENGDPVSPGQPLARLHPDSRVRIGVGVKPQTGSPGARIVAIGEHRPTRIVTNDEICATSIRRTHGSASAAASSPGATPRPTRPSSTWRRALHRRRWPLRASRPTDVDLVLLATCTHPYQTPGGSSEVQDRLGAVNAGAMDINAACAGFAYALSIANDAVRGGSARNVVVIGSEKMTDFVDPHDRGMAFLFGDGAGAAVVSASPTSGHRPGRVGQRRFAREDHHPGTDLHRRCSTRWRTANRCRRWR